ncbi:MAG: hypothetical protein ACE5F1_00345 [Planctomycetota bacterium]
MYETPKILTVLLALFPAVHAQSAPEPAARVAPEPPIPDLDYGLRTADLVVVAELASDAQGSRHFVVRETLAGKAAPGRLPVADFEGLAVHFKPKENGEHLFFLDKLTTGYYPVQKPGLMLPWRKEQAASVSRLLPLLQELRRTRAERGDRSSRRCGPCSASCRPRRGGSRSSRLPPSWPWRAGPTSRPGSSSRSVRSSATSSWIPSAPAPCAGRPHAVWSEPGTAEPRSCSQGS